MTENPQNLPTQPVKKQQPVAPVRQVPSKQPQKPVITKEPSTKPSKSPFPPHNTGTPFKKSR